MDKSTIIYLIAIGLFILSKVFSKKKQAAEEPTEGSPFDTIFGDQEQKPTTRRSDPFDEIFESFGKAEPIVETPKVEPTPPPARGYYTEEVESEEEAFQSYEEQVVDTPAATFVPIDKVEPAYYNQALISAENEGSYGAKSTPIATFEPEVGDIGVEMQEEDYEYSSYFSDFDLRKAMVYTEVLKPKFQQI